MKQIHSLLLFASSLILLPTHSMDLATTNANEEPKSDKIVFLEKTVKDINQYKTTNPEKYLNDMGKVANTIYATTFLTDRLNRIKKHYQKTEDTKDHVFYNKRFINGYKYPFFEKSESDTITTPVGTLINHTPSYGDKEYSIFLSTPEERAFAKKIESIKSNGDENTLKFLKKYLNHDNINIKNLANSGTYISANYIIMSQILPLRLIATYLNQATAKKYFAAFNLNNLFKKELISTQLAIHAFDIAKEAAPSFLEKIKPLCDSQIFNELEKESNLLSDYYKTMLKNCKDSVAHYAETTLKHNNKLKIKHHKLCNQILNQYFSVTPELKDAFSLFGINGLLPGVLPFEAHQQSFLSIKAQPTQTKRKEKNRKHKANPVASAINQSENLIEQKNNNTESNNVNTDNITATPTREKLIESNKESSAICYDERILKQNMNKKDHYHGFTLITTPYIIQYGKQNAWNNKKTGKKDALFSMNGEIHYEKTNSTKYAQFDICKGSDGAIYHIGMRITKETNNNQAYDVIFPPLGTIVKTYQSSISDEYDSKVLKETEFMIQIWDGGLNATITLYK